MDETERKLMGKAGLTTEEIQLKNDLELEGELQKDLRSLLAQRDVWVMTNRFGKRSTATKGAPDFLFMWNGRAYGFECKVGNRETTKKQLETHMHMRRNGWLVFVVRSLKEAQEFLDGKPQTL
jgi:hypothetical protein